MYDPDCDCMTYEEQKKNHCSVCFTHILEEEADLKKCITCGEPL